MRLISLDVLRGWAVIGMVVVNSAAAVKWVDAAVFPALLHVPWSGLTLADLVFPAFLTMVGASIPFSLQNARLTRVEGVRVLGRAARLLLLGFLLSNLYWFQDFESGTWRLFGVLQRIGLVYAACALLFLACGPRLRLGIAAAILVLYWPLVLLPGLDGIPADIEVAGRNFAASVDRMLLGSHRYVQGPLGYDPEGILATFPAIGHGLLGVAAGEMLAAGRQGGARRLALLGAGLLAAGLVWSAAFPIIKDIWSSSFVFVTCGGTLLLLAILHAWLDSGRPQGLAARLVSAPALPFGGNAIAAYSLHMVTAGMVTWHLLLLPFHATRGAIGDGAASLLPIALYLAFIWICVEYLRRRKWVIKI